MSSSIPSGWCSGALTEFTDLKHGFQFRTPDFSDKGIKVIKIGQVIGNGKIDLSTCDYVLPEIYEMRKSFSLKTGDILMSLTGNIGRVGIVPELAEPLLQNYRVGLFEPNSDACFKWYLFHLLSSEFVTNQLLDKSNTTAQANFGKSDLDQVVVAFPPLPEQQKIAAILTSVDDVIESTQAQINKLKDLKTGMMQELLTKGIGRGGLPHTEFKDSPVGRIPNAWEVVELEKLCTWMGVGIATSTTHAYTDNGVPLLRNQNILAGTIDKSDILQITKEFSDENKSKKIKSGDVITIRTGYPGKSAVVPNEFNDCHTFTTLISRPNMSLLNSNYLALIINSDYGMSFVAGGQAGGAQQNLNVSILKAFPVKLPSLDEQGKIFELVNSISLKIKCIDEKLAKFKNFKKALMQDLLTGKVRVKVN